MKKSSILFYIMVGVLLVLLLGTVTGWIAPIRVGTSEVFIIIVLLIVLAVKWLFDYLKK